MSSFGSPYAQPPQPPEPPQPSGPETPEPSSDIPSWMLLLAVLVVLSMAGLLLYAITQRGDDHPAEAPASPSPAFPQHWNKRIAPYARIAAKQRGLRFLHPVPVRFLAPKPFARAVVHDSGEVSKHDRAQIVNDAGLLRALGLLSGKVDLLEAVHQFSADEVLAYYSFQDQRITVRGHRLTPGVRSTLVHELTHVLQDQHFHVGDRMKQLQKKGDDTRSSVLDAIVEGDAVRVETKYRASLGTKQQAALDAEKRREGIAGRRQIRNLPPALVTMLTSPYTLGEALVETVAARGGNAAVDRLLRHPPEHETVLLDPFRVLTRQTGATHVAAPALRSGEKRFDSGELGVLTWYFMLGERLPLTDALSAADGWGGDDYVAYQRHGTPCVRADYVGRTAADTAGMYDALARWIAAGPSSMTSLVRTGPALRFQSCDPGAGAAARPDTTEQAMRLVAIRAGLGIGLAKHGVPVPAARCMAGRMVQDYPVSELTDPSFGTDPSVQEHLRAMALACG